MTAPTKIHAAASTRVATTDRSVPPILEVDSVVFGYGAETIIDNVSFDGRAGDFISIIGPSGCGKSTLLTLLDGMAQPLAGSVRVNGQRPLPGEPSRSMVFQNFALMPWKTVLDNVELGLRYRRRDLAKKERYDIAHEYLKKVGLDRSSKLYPRHLSGGMQQRVGLARAFAVQPQILLMDEPFGALDAQNAEILREDVRALVQEEQRTVVFVTHNLDEALQLSNRILLMTAGPGRIREAVTVDLPDEDSDDYPARYEAYRKQLWMHLRQEVNETRAREEEGPTR